MDAIGRRACPQRLGSALPVGSAMRCQDRVASPPARRRGSCRPPTRHRRRLRSSIRRTGRLRGLPSRGRCRCWSRQRKGRRRASARRRARCVISCVMGQPPASGTRRRKRASLTGVTSSGASRSLTCSPLNRMITRPRRTASSATSIWLSASSGRTLPPRGVFRATSDCGVFDEAEEGARLELTVVAIHLDEHAGAHDLACRDGRDPKRKLRALHGWSPRRLIDRLQDRCHAHPMHRLQGDRSSGELNPG